jgi:hypothetical protein
LGFTGRRSEKVIRDLITGLTAYSAKA